MSGLRRGCRSCVVVLLIASGWFLRAQQAFSLTAEPRREMIPRRAVTALQPEITKLQPLPRPDGLPGSNVVAITKPQDLVDLLDHVGKTGQWLVVDYYAPWCRACQNLLRYMQKLAKQPAFQDVEFASVDFDQSEELVKSRQVDLLPTMEIYQGQQLKQRWSGANTKK